MGIITQEVSQRIVTLHIYSYIFVLACLFVIISGKQRPCGKHRLIEYCVCADGRTYEGRRVRRSCKPIDDNPPEQCQCKDGSYWRPDAEYEYEMNSLVEDQRG